jgi:hypothetical protein
MKKLILMLVGFAVITTSVIVEAATIIDKKTNTFSIILLPDTQNYLKYKNADKKFFAQTEWIKKNKEKLNIKFVIHEGDVTDDNSPEQWILARKCMAVLDGQVPYAMCVGNHDVHHNGSAKSDISTYFKESDYEQESWWGGKMPDENCFYYYFEAAGQKYLILSLNFGPSDKMLEWADGIVEENPECKVMMVTHVYVADDGELSSKKSLKNAGFYGSHANGDRRNTGEQVWNKHVKKHENYIMVFSGHLRGPAARNTMTGVHGNQVCQMLANYQYEHGGGDGFLRIVEINPNTNEYKVSTFSPFLNEYLKDDANEFFFTLNVSEETK